MQKMKKRLSWTLGMALGGALLGAKSEGWTDLLLGSFFGGAIGLGMIFTTEHSRQAILYWAVTFAGIGLILGLEEPITIHRLVIRSAFGSLTGVLLGVLVQLARPRKVTH